MTTEQQRIAIAEACGWKRIPADNVGAAARLFYGDVWWRDAENNTIASVEQLPDYLSDLNAMHEAEKLIMLHPHAAKTRCRYHAYLADLCKIDAIHATASQRAEAFLRTLNLYKKP